MNALQIAIAVAVTFATLVSCQVKNSDGALSATELHDLLTSTVSKDGPRDGVVFFRNRNNNNRQRPRTPLPGVDDPVFVGGKNFQPNTGISFGRPSPSRSAVPLSARLKQANSGGSGENADDDDASQQHVDERFTVKGLREIHLLGGPCAASGCSQIEGAACNEGICVCLKTHIPVGRTLCLPLATFYSDGCLISQQCRPIDPLAICYNSRCMCDPVFTVAGISCNTSSSIARQVAAGINVYGVGSRGKIECMPKLNLNQTCCDSKQCAVEVEESECERESMTCQCKFGSIAVGDKACMKKAYKFGDPCVSDVQCTDLSKNSNADAVCSAEGMCLARCPPPLIAVPLQSALNRDSPTRRKRQNDDDSDDSSSSYNGRQARSSRHSSSSSSSKKHDKQQETTTDATTTPAATAAPAAVTESEVTSGPLTLSHTSASSTPPPPSPSPSSVTVQPQDDPAAASSLQQLQQQQQQLEQQPQYDTQQQQPQYADDTGSGGQPHDEFAQLETYSSAPPRSDYVGPVACMRPARLGEQCQHSLQCQAQEPLALCRDGQCMCVPKAIPFADRCVPPHSSDLTRLRSQIMGFDSGLLAPDTVFGQTRFTLRAPECCAASNFSSAQYIGVLRALQPTNKFASKIVGNDDFQIDPETLEIFSLRPQPIVKQEILQVQATVNSGFSPPELINVYIEPASCCLRRPSAEARSPTYAASLYPGNPARDGTNCHGLGFSDKGSSRRNNKHSSSSNGDDGPVGQASNADSLFVLRPGLFSFKHCGEPIMAYDTQVGPPDVCDLQGNMVRFTSATSMPAGGTATCTLTAIATGCHGMQAKASAEVYIIGDSGCVAKNQ